MLGPVTAKGVGLALSSVSHGVSKLLGRGVSTASRGVDDIAILERLGSSLRPGGKLIGRGGTTEEIRVLDGGREAAERYYKVLSEGGTPTNKPTYKGVGVDLPGGGFIGLRESTKHGLTIEINVPGFNDIQKIHFK